MREIKFRAWNKIWKCMYDLNGFRLVGKKHIQLYYLDDDGESSTCTVLLENIILMQYTGLKDKNGKEIYEGDIVRTVGCVPIGLEMETRTHINLVEYWNSYVSIGYRLRNQNGKTLMIKSQAMLNTMETEIIGNIYENPELLEVSHE